MLFRICFLIIGTFALEGHCHDDHMWVKYKNKHYMVVGESMTWMDAQSVCKTLGGFLATVSNAGESNFIKSMTHVAANNIWIGGTDMFAEGRWVWIENLRSVSYNNWFTVSGGKEPSGGVGDNCMVWLHYSGFYWHDSSCSSKFKFVCQRSPRKKNRR